MVSSVREQQLDDLAELVADGHSIEDAADAVGVSRAVGHGLWAVIRFRLGGQAR